MKIKGLKTLLLIAALLFSIGKLHAQEQEEIYSKIEQSAEFPGGIDSFFKFMSKNLKYPPDAKKNNVQGKVFLTFVVEKDGSLTDIKVVRGIGYGCDEEAIRVMKLSPKWNAAMHDNKPVRQQYTIPILFQR
ncbi:TonB family protein [Mucilaginibacter yixingensis]|uniref:TonB family protein n=1 Tax=Mucilaginibacter yixingensis TaxID=1295612 RepID=A0A2T5J8C3_9SPHI|nr:energy transducer TonB [Mucilaginibacter yixingensis]PTQ95705.1 TonB family protein [Mucilaginibacter yixingensis]